MPGLWRWRPPRSLRQLGQRCRRPRRDLCASTYGAWTRDVNARFWGLCPAPICVCPRPAALLRSPLRPTCFCLQTFGLRPDPESTRGPSYLLRGGRLLGVQRGPVRLQIPRGTDSAVTTSSALSLRLTRPLIRIVSPSPGHARGAICLHLTLVSYSDARRGGGRFS